MENVADALRMAFAVIVFVIAMAIALSLLSQANATTTQIFYSMDKITYLDKSEIRDADHRIVGLETIIPTIYRYPVENCGVTIVSKDMDGNYELVARYDIATDNVAEKLEALKANKDTERYKEAARIYYTHIDYLVENLKIENENIFINENNGPIDGYSYNEELDDAIKEAYKYTITTTEKDEETGEEAEKEMNVSGIAWGTDHVAQRLESDLSGEEMTIEGKIYTGICEDGLLEYLGKNKFEEYIIEVGVNNDIEDQEELQTVSKTKKLEIIYVEQ